MSSPLIHMFMFSLFHPVLITVDLQCILKQGSPPIFLSFVKIALGSQCPFKFHMDFKVGFSSFAKMTFGSLIAIALNLQTTLELSLLNMNRDVFSFIWVYFNIFSVMFYCFWYTRLNLFGQIYSYVFYFLGCVVNGTVLLILRSHCSSLVYRDVMMVHCPCILQLCQIWVTVNRFL